MKLKILPVVERDDNLKTLIKSIIVDQEYIGSLLSKNGLNEKQIRDLTIYLCSEDQKRGTIVTDGLYTVKHKKITLYIGTQVRIHNEWQNSLEENDPAKSYYPDVYDWVSSKIVSEILLHELKHYIEDSLDHNKYIQEIDDYESVAEKNSKQDTLTSQSIYITRPWEIRAVKFSQIEIKKAEKNEHLPILIKLKT
jgi:hypothetical protein